MVEEFILPCSCCFRRLLLLRPAAVVMRTESILSQAPHTLKVLKIPLNPFLPLLSVVGFLVVARNPSGFYQPLFQQINTTQLILSYRFTNHCTMFFNCKTVFREELIVELMHREVGRTLFSFHTSLTPALSSALPFRWPPTPPPSPMPRCAPTPQPPRMSFSKTLLSLYQRPARSCPCLDPVQ